MSPGLGGRLDSPAARLRAVGVCYVLTVVVWVAVFPPNVGDVELFDTTLKALSFAFAAASMVLVFRIGVALLELGWVVFTYSFFVRLLDELAEGPEQLESILPGALEIVGLALLLVGFVRTTDRLRTDLAERDERLSVMNRVLRHNLRNSLVTIISSLEHLSAKADEEADRRAAERALSAARDLSEMSDKIRDVDAILENSDGSRTVTQDLDEVVETVVEEYRGAYPDVAFETDLATDVTVDAVPGVEAAVGNVVENACEHTDADRPAVTVTVGEDGGAGAVVVRDNGSGIPEDELEPVRSGTESDLSHGSGVGLWVVTWLVERSNGSVSFDYDDGQVVTVRFPLAEGRRRYVGRPLVGT